MARRHGRREADDLVAFADKARRAAERVASSAPSRKMGTYGGYKVFIHAAWAIGHFKESLPSFKKRLVEANREGLVQLGRADLTGAMNPYDLRRSSTDDGAFNFIVLDPRKFADF